MQYVWADSDSSEFAYCYLLTTFSPHLILWTEGKGNSLNETYLYDIMVHVHYGTHTKEIPPQQL